MADRQEYAIISHTFEQQPVVNDWCMRFDRSWFLRYFRDGLWHTEMTIEEGDYIALHDLLRNEQVKRLQFAFFPRRDEDGRELSA